MPGNKKEKRSKSAKSKSKSKSKSPMRKKSAGKQKKENPISLLTERVDKSDAMIVDILARLDSLEKKTTKQDLSEKSINQSDMNK